MGMPMQKMTMAEFLAWEEEQPERHEFYRGETFAMVGGTLRHNRVILNLASHITDQLDGTGCQVFAESVKVQIAEGILYPDVLVTRGKAEADDEKIITDPKLVIEVLSPSTKGYDRRVDVHTLAGEDTWTLVDQSKSSHLTLGSVDLALTMEAVFKGVERAA